MKKLTLGIVVLLFSVLVGCFQNENNPIESTSSQEPTTQISDNRAEKILDELANQKFTIKKDQISEEDYDSIVTFGKAFVNLYSGAVAEQEMVSFENYITNRNLLRFTTKMLELEQKQELNGGIGVKFGLENEFKEVELNRLDANLYYLNLPFSNQGSGWSCKLLVQSANKSLVIADLYFGNRDGVDTMATGHPTVRKFDNPKLWDDPEWVDAVFEKLEQYESELNSRS